MKTKKKIPYMPQRARMLRMFVDRQLPDETILLISSRFRGKTDEMKEELAKAILIEYSENNEKL